MHIIAYKIKRYVFCGIEIYISQRVHNGHFIFLYFGFKLAYRVLAYFAGDEIYKLRKVHTYERYLNMTR